jgi:hypothetical protein
MKRSALLTLAVLGGLVCLLGGTVLYSALQDTARTGTNSVESAALASSADIQLATATQASAGSPITCGTFSDDLESGLITATGVLPSHVSSKYFCVKNVGSQQVTLSGLVDELTDVDVACTGDEAGNGDATCGGDQVGELSNVLGVTHVTVSCAAGGGSGPVPILLKDNATTPLALGTLAAGATGCYMARVDMPSGTGPFVQRAQSDRATWRFKFTAQA